MRPVRLEVEGFTCYRERQSPLTFDGLSLFAIAGPTGAGKSSILDAMLFALYGEVPRIGKQGVGEIIAQGRDAVAVTLDFSVRDTTYRVARRAKRTRSGINSSAILEELAPAARPLCEQVRPVNEEIKRLLGLDFGAFTQTVILPQGEFAKFLKADPKEQRGILQHLLRHQVFERMRAEAERRRGEAHQAVSVLERTLAGSEHATAAALASAREALAARQRELADLTDLKDAQAAALETLRIRRQLTIEAHGLRARLAVLNTEAPAIADARAELAAARDAAQIVPRIEAARAGTARLQLAVHERAGAEEAATLRQRAVAAAEKRLAATTAHAEQETVLSLRIRALDEIKGEVGRRAVLRTRHAEVARALPPARARGAATATALERARAARADAAVRVDRARDQIAAAGFDPVEEQRLQDLWTTVVQLRAVLDDVTTLTEQQRGLDDAAKKAERALASTEKTLKAATRELERASAAAGEAEHARHAGRTTHQVAAVREHLHAGEACPVCLQTVVLMPPSERVPELDALDQQFDVARRTLDEATTAKGAAAEARAGAHAKLESSQQMRDGVTATLQQKWTSSQALTATLSGAISDAGGPEPLELVAVVERRRVALRTARQMHERAVDSCRVAEAALALADVAVVKADAEAVAASEALERCVADEARLSTELDALEARITAVSCHADPSAERDGLASQLTALEGVRRDAAEGLSVARAAVASSGARLEAARSSEAQAADAASVAGAALAEALAAGGFASADEVSVAARTAQQQAALDASIRRHESDHAGVTSRLLVVEPQVTGAEVSADALAQAEAECQAAVASWRAADLDVAARTSAVGRLASDVARRQKDEAELVACRGNRDLLTGMASDLKGDAFQEYLLEEAFHALVAGASVRMRQMSNRYTLEWKDGSFFVIDHDNAGDRRRAETLSGGETFMASLCLALQLSDEVLKTSGALQMDSLFIDEGFGTLDADALAEVTDAMELLGQDGARLIGVISHRPELTERLPGCIRVTKGAGESSWALERVG